MSDPNRPDSAISEGTSSEPANCSVPNTNARYTENEACTTRLGKFIFPRPVSFPEALKVCLIQKYATFRGRACRSEYWFFFLFTWVLNILLGLVDVALNPGAGSASNVPFGLSNIVSLLVVIPTLAVGARRLHDLNRTGWWMLLPLTIIGIPVFIYWMCKQGTAENEPNSYTECVPLTIPSKQA